MRHASLICDIHMLNCSFMRDISGYYGMNLVNGHELDNDFGFSSGGPSRIWLEVCMRVCIYTQIHMHACIQTYIDTAAFGGRCIGVYLFV